MLSEDVEKILVEGKDGYDKVKKITKNAVRIVLNDFLSILFIIFNLITS